MIEWKRYRACEKCRKSKTRCEYEGPYDKKCKRCTRLNLECIQKEPKRGIPSNSKSIAIQKSPTPTPIGAKYKSEICEDLQLQKASGIVGPNGLIEASNGVLTGLDAADTNINNKTNAINGTFCTANTSMASPMSTVTNGSLTPGSTPTNISTGGFSVENLTLRQLHRPDCLNLAFEIGLYTMENAALFFDLYMAGMNESANLGINDTASLDLMVKERPLLALTIITVCAVCSTIDKAEERAQFCKRIIFEHIFGKRQASLETLQCLLVCEQFMLVIKTRSEADDSPFMGSTSDLSDSLELMKSIVEDIDKSKGMTDRLSYVSGLVISTNGTDVTKYYPLGTKITILACTECLTAGMGFLFGTEVKDISEDWRKVIDFCIESHDPSLILASCLVRLMVRFSYITCSLLKLPSDDITSVVTHHESLMQECREVEELSSTILSHRSPSIPVALYNLTVMKMKLTRVSAHELVLSRFLVNKVQLDTELLWPSTLGAEIRKVCLEVLDEVAALTAKSSRYPRYVFIRPVQVLAMLARLHILSYVTSELSFDVDELDKALSTADQTYKKLMNSSMLVRSMYELRLSPVLDWIRNMVEAEKVHGPRLPPQKMPPDHILVPPAVQFVLSNINLPGCRIGQPGLKCNPLAEEDVSFKKVRVLDETQELPIVNDETLSNLEVDQIMQDLFKISPLEYFPS